MKSVLVTGAYGFVGRNAAKALARRGFDVTAIGHGSWARGQWRSWGISKWYSADISLDTLIKHAGRPDAIVHCAGGGSVSYSIDHPRQDFDRSVVTTLEVLEYIRLVHPKTILVLPSSAGVYGAVNETPIATSQALVPVSPYGLHKRIAEDLCRSYSRHYGISCAIVRLFSVYGVGLRKQLLWEACNKLRTADVQFSGTGNETRDWLHIDDAAELLVCALSYASNACPVVNGGEGIATTVRSVVTLLADQFPSSSPPVFSGQVRPEIPRTIRLT